MCVVTWRLQDSISAPHLLRFWCADDTKHKLGPTESLLKQDIKAINLSPLPLPPVLTGQQGQISITQGHPVAPCRPE